MSTYRVQGLPAGITDAVRTTMKSPGYGHPVVKEIATGTGPCRACLEPFVIGAEERGSDNRVPAARRVSGAEADTAIAQLFADYDVESVNVRHGEAGCHIVQVNRVRNETPVGMSPA